jgi:hypothetical protein
MRGRLEFVAERVTWGQVAAGGALAVVCLLGLAAWAGEGHGQLRVV